MIFGQAIHVCSEDRLTLLASVSGQALNNIFTGLLNGSSLFPLNVNEEGSASLAEWLTEEQITVFYSASPLFRAFMGTLAGEEEFPSVRVVRLASQTVFQSDVESYKRHFSQPCIFVNSYSTTESNLLCDYFIDKNTHPTTGTVPVGYSVADKEIWLLDEDGNKVDSNLVGEIVVKSRYLSTGYWGKPGLAGLDRETFLPDPEGGPTLVPHGRPRLDAARRLPGTPGTEGFSDEDPG